MNFTVLFQLRVTNFAFKWFSVVSVYNEKTPQLRLRQILMIITPKANTLIYEPTVPNLNNINPRQFAKNRTKMHGQMCDPMEDHSRILPAAALDLNRRQHNASETVTIYYRHPCFESKL